MERHDGDRESDDVLLKRQVSIDGDKDVTRLSSSPLVIAVQPI